MTKKKNVRKIHLDGTAKRQHSFHQIRKKKLYYNSIIIKKNRTNEREVEKEEKTKTNQPKNRNSL